MFVVLAALIGWVSWFLLEWLGEHKTIRAASHRAVYGALWASIGYMASWLVMALS